MSNKIVGITVEADWSYFSDPVRIMVSRQYTTPRTYHARPASATRSARAVSELIRRMVGQRKVTP